jgi:3-dehydroquinate dehydratase / shikimate dehydrogenase
MTRLCVAIFVTDLPQARRDIAAAAEAGADLVELRVDSFTDLDAIRQLVSSASLPCIVTCRPSWEGGQSDLPDQERIPVLEAAAVSGASYIDIELESYRKSANLRQKVHFNAGSPVDATAPREKRAGLIVSSHDFQGRPTKLHNLLAELDDTGGDISKIVWTARTIRDNLEAFEILKHRTKPTVALCMGEAGLISRILAKKFGAFLTFASLKKDTGTASGQVPIADMKKLYRWDAITEHTKIYGVVASPVGHSMSPAIHNAAFSAVGHDGVYLPFLVEPGYESFKAFMETFLNFDGLHLSGLSVTIPHKENALRYLKEKNAEIEPLAESIGAVNTIVIEGSGVGELSGFRVQGSGQNASPSPEPRALSPRLRGFNTDYAAILDAITAKLNCTRDDLANYRVAILGAGGTGRTAVAALASCGATVVVYNRTKDKADALANEFNGRTGRVVSARLEKLCDSCCHIFINTTSVGMSPNIDASPLGDAPPKFTDETLVFDTIYNPMKTKLLAQAEACGAKTIGGVEMFVRQAAGQFKAWTGMEAPSQLMRRVIKDRLGGK